MHAGNLSFVSDTGRPYAMSPAYDMLPMAFSPTSGGQVRDSIGSSQLHACVDGTAWRRALELAQQYVSRLRNDARFSANFGPCIRALGANLDDASQKIARIG